MPHARKMVQALLTAEVRQTDTKFLPTTNIITRKNHATSNLEPCTIPQRHVLGYVQHNDNEHPTRAYLLSLN